MLRTLSIGAIIGIFVMLTGCQSEDQREAAQRRREAEAEQTLEDLFGGLAEALEEVAQSEMSPIGKVVRQAENLGSTAMNQRQSGGETDYDKFAEACDMIMELIENH